MSDLDKKLDEILQPWLEEVQSEYGTGIDDDKKPQFIAVSSAKAKIKQAFIDAGWRQFIGADSVNSIGSDQINSTVIDYDKPPNDMFGKPVLFMTGQEWYNRFVAEVEAFNHDNRGSVDIYLSDYLVQAAKKASGLE